MAESSIDRMFAYGTWESTNDTIETMYELHDYHFNHEFWFDCTRGNLNRRNYDWDTLMLRLQEYEKLLFESFRQLQCTGWQLEPVHDALIWSDFDWLL